MDILIIDDVVDKKTQDEIEDRALGFEPQWTLARSIFYDANMYPEVAQAQRKRMMAFTKLLVNVEDKTLDPTFSFYNQPLKSAKLNHGIAINRVLNARLQLQLPTINLHNRAYGVPHIDAHRDFKFKVGVYYTNDVDGDTVIFKQTTKDSVTDVKDLAKESKSSPVPSVD
jgi:hypothetical protein